MTSTSRVQTIALVLSLLFASPFVFTAGLLVGAFVYTLATGDDRGNGYFLAGYAGAAVSCSAMALALAAWWKDPSPARQTTLIVLSVALAQPFLYYTGSFVGLVAYGFLVAAARIPGGNEDGPFTTAGFLGGATFCILATFLFLLWWRATAKKWLVVVQVILGMLLLLVVPPVFANAAFLTSGALYSLLAGGGSFGFGLFGLFGVFLACVVATSLALLWGVDKITRTSR